MLRSRRQFATCATLVTWCCLAMLSHRWAVSQQIAAMRLAVPALPNAYRLHEGVISGGQPDGEAGFQALRKLGVRTVISVDGAKPDLSLAKKHGLRYVHLPHGYDGIPEQRVLELAKAVSELPRPIYIHCHHGKHRSPVAAAVACISAGLITREAGREFLRLAGTGGEYQGLYAAVDNARQRPEAKELDTEFQESVDVAPMATAMVRIERTFEHLKQIEDADWETPAARPDLTPTHEALLLREDFSELLRTREVQRRPAAFRELLEQSRANAEWLEQQLRENRAARKANAESGERLSAKLALISNRCVECHAVYRD